MHRIYIKPQSAEQTLGKLIAAIRTGYGDIGFSSLSFNAGFGAFQLQDAHSWTTLTIGDAPDYKNVRQLLEGRSGMPLTVLNMNFRDGLVISYADYGNVTPYLDISGINKEPRFENAVKLFHEIQKKFSVIR